MNGQRPICHGIVLALSLTVASARVAHAEDQQPNASSTLTPKPLEAPVLVAMRVLDAPADAPPAAEAPATTPASDTVPAPATAPAPAPAVAVAPVSSVTRVATSPGEAVVHVAVSYRDAWLEMRSYVDGGAFVRTCATPCDLKVQVEGREARVVAPGMTTSNIFRFEAGGGTAGVRVDGGSATARRAGIITLALGIPVALAGMGLFAQGRVKDRAGLQAAGIAGLAAGGLSVVISLPLLIIGSTHVKDAKGSFIASNEPLPEDAISGDAL